MKIVQRKKSNKMRHLSEWNFSKRAVDSTFSERKILEQVANHKTSRQIADMLFLSERTVEGHNRKTWPA